MGILQEKVSEYKHLHIPGWIILINNGLVSRFMYEKDEGISCYLVFYIFIFKSFNVCSLMCVAFDNRKTRLFFDFAYQDMQTHTRFFVYFISKALLICITIPKMKIKFQIIWEMDKDMSYLSSTEILKSIYSCYYMAKHTFQQISINFK